MLDTLSNVKSALAITGSTDDTLLSRLMDGADGFIAIHTGRDFAGGTFTELHPAGRDVLFLRNFPVTSVTSVKVDPARAFGSDTVRASDTYVLDADRGLIRSLRGSFLPPRFAARDDWPGAAQVVYATATSAVPAAVKQAFSDLIGHWYRTVKTFTDQQYQMIVERLSGTDSKAWSWSVSSGMTMPPGVLELLEPYRVPVV